MDYIGLVVSNRDWRRNPLWKKLRDEYVRRGNKVYCHNIDAGEPTQAWLDSKCSLVCANRLKQFASRVGLCESAPCPTDDGLIHGKQMVRPDGKVIPVLPKLSECDKEGPFTAHLSEATVTPPTSKFVPQNEYTSDSDDAEDTESGEVLLIDVLPADIAEILAAYDPTLVTRDDVITLCQNSPTNEQALVAIKDIGPARAKAILGALEI